MYYQIEVWKMMHGSNVCLFTTNKHSINEEYRFKGLLKLLKEKFPEEEGYEVKPIQWNKIKIL